MSDNEKSEYVVVVEDGDSYTAWEEKTVYKWPHEAIVQLIEEFKVREKLFRDGLSKKKGWISIAKVLTRNGYPVNGSQCQSKYSGLIRTFKSIKKQTNQYKGRKIVTWPYYDMIEDVCGAQIVQEPITPYIPPPPEKKSKLVLSSSSESDSEDEMIYHKLAKRKRKEHKFHHAIISELRAERKQMEKNMERRHKENMEIKYKLFSTLDNLCKNLCKMQEKNITGSLSSEMDTTRKQVEENIERRHQENLEMKQTILNTFDNMCTQFGIKE